MYFNNNRTTIPSTLYGTQTQWDAPRYNKAPSKVVSIPVRFVGSDRNRTDSVMKIQRVARGYLVRKSVKKMLNMKVELEEIEKKVNNEETVKMMKKEEKERIRIGETIMNLLLRLDSVRVFNCCALRELRKFLIKRAIFLQEIVDGEGKCGKEEDDSLMKVKEEEEEESVGSSLMEENSEDRNVIGSEEEEEEENREMLRKMMNENEKMMYMMTQLFDRNEKQTSILTSLTQRVEQLERAFTCEKMKKKNKRRRHVDAKHRYI